MQLKSQDVSVMRTSIRYPLCRIGDAYLAEKILDALPLGGVPLREVLQHSDLRLEVRGQLLPHVVGRVLPVEEP